MVFMEPRRISHEEHELNRNELSEVINWVDWVRGAGSKKVRN
jgi:hypothetical protein